MYDIIKGTGKSINTAVNDALNIVYGKKTITGNIPIDLDIPIDIYEKMERKFTSVEEAAPLLVELTYLDLRLSETRQKLKKLQINKN
ncbi:predicted protein [Methanosarcina acetivorans C2A]|uniref:Uncharacterized protein n=2 Tax=Methanosarcina acetivorans TaxID=2214 RepID=Q8TNQ8_METAC|nr:predicted protein [Methanosarcina acetivorans C2A]